MLIPKQRVLGSKIRKQDNVKIFSKVAAPIYTLTCKLYKILLIHMFSLRFAWWGSGPMALGEERLLGTETAKGRAHTPMGASSNSTS